MVDNALSWIVGEGEIDQIVDRVASLRTPHPTRYQLDERWARFMTVTKTNSHYSAEQFLVERQHDYAAVPNDWVRLRYLPFVFPPQPETEGPPTRQPRGLRDVIANHETRDHQARPVEPFDGTDEGDEIVRPRLLSDDGEELGEIF